MQLNTEELKCNTVDFNAIQLNKYNTVEYNAIKKKLNVVQSLQAAREQTGGTTQWTARGEINGE